MTGATERSTDWLARIDHLRLLTIEAHMAVAYMHETQTSAVDALDAIEMELGQLARVIREPERGQ